MTGNLGGRKLFVGGLPPKVDDRALREVFSQYWNVEEVILVTDRETRKSRGFGYVVFGSEREAKEAMNSMSGERGKKYFDHEMTIEYARDKESSSPRQMRGGGRGGFAQRGRPPPRGSPFRGPPGQQRGPPGRPRDGHPPARGREPHMPPPGRGHPPRGPPGEPRRGPPPPERYDDYGPPDRSYPPRDYDRGGYGDRERERPPSYSSEHYGNRYPPQERGGSGNSYPSSDRAYGPPMDRGYGSSERYSSTDRYSAGDRGYSDRYGASDERYPAYDRGYGGDRQDSSGGGYGSSDRGYGALDRSYPPPDRGYGPPPERPRAAGYGGAPSERPYSSGSYSGGRDW